MGRVNTALQISAPSPSQDKMATGETTCYITGQVAKLSFPTMHCSLGDITLDAARSLSYIGGRARSAARHLRLICFEASERSSSSCRFGDPVAPADPFEFAFSYDFYSDANFTVVGPLRRAKLGRLGLHF